MDPENMTGSWGMMEMLDLSFSNGTSCIGCPSISITPLARSMSLWHVFKNYKSGSTDGILFFFSQAIINWWHWQNKKKWYENLIKIIFLDLSVKLESHLNKAEARDDFPAPVLPTMAIFCPLSTEKLRFLKTRSRCGRYRSEKLRKTILSRK